MKFGLQDTSYLTYLLLDIPYAILSIPIISRLIASIKVNRMAPVNGDANTINYTAKDNIPTPIRNFLDHLEIFLFVIP